MPITAWAKAEPMWANWTRCSGPTHGVGADIEQQDRPLARIGQRQGQGRTVDAAVTAQMKQPSGQRRSGRSPGHEGLRTTVRHRAGRLDDRGLGRGADRVGRIGLLGDRDRGVDHLDAGRHGSDLVSRAEEQNPDPVGGRARSARRYFPGAEIRPAGVHGDGHHGTTLCDRLVPIRDDHLASLVVPADGADAVGKARAVAMGTRVVRRRFDLMLRTTLRGPRVGLLLLGDGHGGQCSP